MTCVRLSKTYFRSSGGFTLIEVLVSLTIMALITAVAFAGLSAGIDSWQRGSQKIDELDRRFAVERLIQRQVALAESQLFSGNDRELSFVSRYSLLNGPGDPVQVRYVVDSGKLSYTEAILTEYRPKSSDAVVTQTLGTFRKIAFRYVGRLSDGRPVWLKEWEKEMGLPFALQLQIADDAVMIPLVNSR